MNQVFDRRAAAEAFAVRMRVLLVLAAGFMLFDRLSDPIITMGIGAMICSAAVGFWALRQQRKGLLARLRYLDGFLIASAAFMPPAVGGTAFMLGVPVIVIHAAVERSQKKTFGLTIGMAAIQLAGMSQHAVSILGVVTSVGAFAFSAAIGLILANLQQREEILSGRDRRLESLLAYGSSFADNRDIRPVLIQAIKTAVEETKAQCGYLMLRDEENTDDSLIPEVAYGRDGEFDFPESVQIGAGLSGFVAKSGQAITISSEEGLAQDFDGATPGVRSAACVPLYGRTGAKEEQVMGVITLLDLNDGKPFPRDDMDLLRTLSSLTAVAISNEKMEERRRTTFLRTLQSLATALEARDEYTRGHSQRVCEVSMLIGEKMGLVPDALEELRIGTILHDIGKIGVPDAILNKRGRLTDEEFLVMKQHPVIGYEICRPLMLSEGVLLIIRNHHEKLDGSGYPDGLKGGELPLSLRIVCVADAFDAMSSRRPYRGVMELSQVMAEMSRGAGTQFDPVVVETLKHLLVDGRLNELYASYWDTPEENEEAQAA